MLHLNLIYGYAKLYLSQPAQTEQMLTNSTIVPGLNASVIPEGVESVSLLKNPHTSRLPTLFFLAALPMHILWFNACIRGILRRRAQSRSTSVPLFVTSVRTRFQAMRHHLRMSREDRDRLRARLGAVYGNAHERFMRRGEGVWVRVYEGLRD
ncbi:TLC domain protein [Ceratobasidium sp. AG-Ba]|nr:TLC domain protein [Ceratobasidium sp. AG-Ba]